MVYMQEFVWRYRSFKTYQQEQVFNYEVFNYEVFNK